MDQGLLPRRYAKALYKYSAEKNVAIDVYALMQNTVAAFNATPALHAALSNPFVSDAEKRSLAIAAAGNNAGDSDVLSDFITLLLKNKRIDLLLQIALAYCMLYRKENNIYSVNIQSASPLNDADKKRICDLVDNHLNGASAEFTFSVDPSLIGGFVVNIENERLDASVKNELEQLRLNLIK